MCLPSYKLFRIVEIPIVAMAEFVSTLTYTDAQKSAAPNLEPAFEHLLRSSMVHESVITALRVNEITDRDTFVNMFNSEAFRDGATHSHPVPRGLLAAGIDPFLSKSLAAGCDSWRSHYEAWKAGTHSSMSITELSASPTVSLASVWQVSSSKHPITSTAGTTTRALATGYRTTSNPARSQTPRTTKRPLASLRPREDGGLALLTGAQRRLPSARCVGQLSFVHNNLV